MTKIWLRYFSFGAWEWLWRSLTYGEFLSMRKYGSLSRDNSIILRSVNEY